MNVVHVSTHDDPLTWNDIAGLPGYATKVSCGLKEEGGVDRLTIDIPPGRDIGLVELHDQGE